MQQLINYIKNKIIDFRSNTLNQKESILNKSNFRFNLFQELTVLKIIYKIYFFLSYLKGQMFS